MMLRRATRILARLPLAVAATVCALTLCVQDACILAEPSSDLPRLPDSRPTILHASVVPPESAVITVFPSSFNLTVELSDPTVDIQYAAFVDWNPGTGEGLVDQPHTSSFDPASISRLRMLTVAIPAPLDLDRCHLVEIVVALHLNAVTNNKSAHTPDPPGGDIATWFYNPTGDVGGCPALDAGIDAAVDAEAGEGGLR